MIDYNKLKEQGQILLIILLIVALGLFIINQFISFRYKAQLSQDPCTICSQARPEFQTCIYNQASPQVQVPIYKDINLTNIGGIR